MFNRKFDKNTFSKLNVLVIGDAMIDAYYYGKINRQSPEANVPIVEIDNKENRLGGAANVALNIATLGAKAHLMCFKGNDNNADELEKMLQKCQIKYVPIPCNRKTTVKARVYNGNEYVLRLDEEDTFGIKEQELQVLEKSLNDFLSLNKIDIAILQDYNKGFFTKESIAIICQLLYKMNIPFTVDPKKDNFFEYRNATLFKPNLKEINWALESKIEGTDFENIKNACSKLILKNNSKNILVTLAENGAIAVNSSGSYYEKAHKRNVIDVSGAGDTVIAVASLLLALNAPLNEILYYSNLAGGLVIEERGVQALDILKLANKEN